MSDDLIAELSDRAKAAGRTAYDNGIPCEPPAWLCPQSRVAWARGWDDRFAEDWAH